jgi:pimeloyl-ACP methyl ester carboxylesterase
LVADGRVEYISAGSGPPTIVLVNGLGVQFGTWALVFPELATTGTVFAYNRLGAGGSAKPGVPQTGVVIVDQLREVPGEDGPVVRVVPTECRGAVPPADRDRNRAGH